MVTVATDEQRQQAREALSQLEQQRQQVASRTTDIRAARDLNDRLRQQQQQVQQQQVLQQIQQQQSQLQEIARAPSLQEAQRSLERQFEQKFDLAVRLLESGVGVSQIQDPTVRDLVREISRRNELGIQKAQNDFIKEQLKNNPNAVASSASGGVIVVTQQPTGPTNYTPAVPQYQALSFQNNQLSSNAQDLINQVKSKSSANEVFFQKQPINYTPVNPGATAPYNPPGAASRFVDKINQGFSDVAQYAGRRLGDLNYYSPRFSPFGAAVFLSPRLAIPFQNQIKPRLYQSAIFQDRYSPNASNTNITNSNQSTISSVKSGFINALIGSQDLTQEQYEQAYAQGADFASYFVPGFGFVRGVSDLGGLTIKGISKGLKIEREQGLSQLAPQVIENFKNLSPIQKAGVIGAGVIALYSGGKFGLRAAESALDYPKFNTYFVNQQTGNRGDILLSRAAAITEQRNLFGTKRFASGTETLTKLTRAEEGPSRFESFTRGVIKPQISEKLPTGSPIYGKPTAFISGALGNVADRTVSIGRGFSSKFGKFTVQQELPGVEFGYITRTKTQAGKVSERFSIGMGINPDDTKVISSELNYPVIRNSQNRGVLSRRNKGVSSGVTFIDNSETAGTIGENTGPSTLLTLPKQDRTTRAIQESQVKTSIESAVRATSQSAASENKKFVNNLLGKAAKTSAAAISAAPAASARSSVDQDFARVLPKSDTIGSRPSEVQKATGVTRLSSSTSVLQLAGQRSGQIEKLRNFLGQGIAQNPNQGTRSGLGITNINIQTLRQNSGNRQSLLQNPRTNTRQRGSPIRSPFAPPRAADALAGRGQRLSGTELSKAYDVFIRRNGKKVRVGKDLPIGLATKRGVDVDLDTLAASFELKESGFTTQKDINYKAPAIFKPSKKNPNRLVQQASTRLGRRSEVTEIMGFKRRKGSARASTGGLFS